MFTLVIKRRTRCLQNTNTNTYRQVASDFSRSASISLRRKYAPQMKKIKEYVSDGLDHKTFTFVQVITGMARCCEGRIASTQALE